MSNEINKISIIHNHDDTAKPPRPKHCICISMFQTVKSQFIPTVSVSRKTTYLRNALITRTLSQSVTWWNTPLHYQHSIRLVYHSKNHSYAAAAIAMATYCNTFLNEPAQHPSAQTKWTIAAEKGNQSRNRNKASAKQCMLLQHILSSYTYIVSHRLSSIQYNTVT